MAINIVEKCNVSPSNGAVSEQVLRLLHFDIVWLPSPLVENILFYKLDCSELHFFTTIVPCLKKSLSLTLKHFPPVAGRFIFPLNSVDMPFIHYVANKDSLPFTIAVSNADFVRLTSNHFKASDEFLDFIPQLPTATYSSSDVEFSVAAVQVTLFPKQGICFGFTHSHAVGDGATMVAFIQTWAAINKHNADLALCEIVSPFYDRSMVEDAERLTTVAWNKVKTLRPTLRPAKSLPTNKVRGTFVLSVDNIRKLKKFVQSKEERLIHVSSYAVVCGYVWSCLAKAAGEGVSDDEPEYFKLPADWRAKVSPPLPRAYFGNCMGLLLAESTHGRLKGNEGFAIAVEEIWGTLQKGFRNDEEWLLRPLQVMGKRVHILGGSPRFDLYSLDYGWGGGPAKFEINFDFEGAVTLCKSRGGGVSIGLSMPRVELDAFAATFNRGMDSIVNSKL